ncbi:MAG: bifunctional phosphoglucose/phosphomannose isomerase [Calditrichia bacterium]
MHNSDSSNFVKFLHQLPQQITDSTSALSEVNFKTIPRSFRHILVAGMGGSAIAGELLLTYLQDELKQPLQVCRNYVLPTYTDEHTLLVACSYSGNTEETLAMTEAAMQRKATIVAVTSGGRLGEMAKEHQFPVLHIPAGLPPRQALGYLFFSILHFFENLGLVSSKKDEVDETLYVLQDIRKHNHPENTKGRNLSSHIAQRLYQKVPIIYTASQLMTPVTVRWRNQFNENAKTLAFSNVLPELNHNEIMGCESPENILSQFNIVLLRDEKGEHPRNNKRLEITREIYRKCGLPIFEVFPEGNSPLARLFSQIYIGDWVSYYLALMYDKDPVKIDSIEQLKKSLEN